MDLSTIFYEPELMLMRMMQDVLCEDATLTTQRGTVELTIAPPEHGFEPIWHVRAFLPDPEEITDAA